MKKILLFAIVTCIIFSANAQETKLYNPAADAAKDIEAAVKKAKAEKLAAARKRAAGRLFMRGCYTRPAIGLQRCARAADLLFTKRRRRAAAVTNLVLAPRGAWRLR